MFDQQEKHDLLMGGALPAGLTALVLLFGAWASGAFVRRKALADAAPAEGAPPPEHRSLAWLGALARPLSVLVSATVVYFVADKTWPAWPTRSEQYWFAFLVILSVASALDGLVSPTPWMRVEGSLFVSAAGAWLVFWKLLETTWAMEGDGFWLLIVALGVHLTWEAVEGRAGRKDAWVALLVLMLTCISATVVLGLSGSIKYAKLSSGLAAIAGAMILVGAIAQDSRVARGASGIVAAALVLLLFMGRHFSELSTLNLVLLGVALMAPWAEELPGIRRWSAWSRVMLVVVLALVPLAIAAYSAKRDFDKSAEESKVIEEASRSFSPLLSSERRRDI